MQVPPIIQYHIRYHPKVLESLAVSFNTMWRSSLAFGDMICDQNCGGEHSMYASTSSLLSRASLTTPSIQIGSGETSNGNGTNFTLISTECSCGCPSVDEHELAGTLTKAKLYHFLNRCAWLFVGVCLRTCVCMRVCLSVQVGVGQELCLQSLTPLQQLEPASLHMHAHTQVSPLGHDAGLMRLVCHAG